jgi:hypothetical protein
MRRAPREHFGEYRDSSARPPARYSRDGKLIGVISVHCMKCETGVTDQLACHHLKICPTIIPRSHWSCCGGADRGSTFCIQNPHPGEYRDSSAKPSKRYSSFHDYVGKIRHYCCTKDSKDEGFRCVHLDTTDEIITCSHWSCCGNLEKHSTSCLVTAHEDKKTSHSRKSDSILPSKEIQSSVLGFRKMRSFSDNFDPEVDSEFTDFEYQDASESDLSIEEYNDGPVVWSPSLSDQKIVGSEGSKLSIDRNSVEYTNASHVLISAVRSPRASIHANSNQESKEVQSFSVKLQHIDELSKKLARCGFSVDFSTLRSKLLDSSNGRLRSERSVSFSDTPRLRVQLPEVSEESGAPRKVVLRLLMINDMPILFLQFALSVDAHFN